MLHYVLGQLSDKGVLWKYSIKKLKTADSVLLTESVHER